MIKFQEIVSPSGKHLPNASVLNVEQD